MERLDLSKIVQHDFTSREYNKAVYDKKQIVLHHTASGNGVNGDINWWLKVKKRIGTCILIARDGTIHQVFSSKYWAYHLGENGKDHVSLGLRYRRNDMESIGIEIDSWGGLKKKGDDWVSYTGTVVPKENDDLAASMCFIAMTANSSKLKSLERSTQWILTLTPLHNFWVSSRASLFISKRIRS